MQGSPREAITLPDLAYVYIYTWALVHTVPKCAHTLYIFIVLAMYSQS